MTDRSHGLPGGAPIPTPWQPGDAYGNAGPSTLDRDARVVRQNDPYAPEPKHAPAVPLMPLPKEALPSLSQHNPFSTPNGPFGTSNPQFGGSAPGFRRRAESDPETHTNGSYGVPMRSAAPVPTNPSAPQVRKGSVAPPGLG